MEVVHLPQLELIFPWIAPARNNKHEVAITNDEAWAAQLTDATNIDRLNIGPLPTIALNWLQPHEGSIVDFLFRTRAYQTPDERLKACCGK